MADGRPTLLQVRPHTPGPGERAAALDGTFDIRGETVSLAAPVDWKQDPFGNRSWRMYLHALDALKPLLVHYDVTGEVVALERACTLALDWIEHNPQDGNGVSEFAWYDMSVAYRAERLAYLYRALAHEHMLTPAVRKRLGCAVVEHATWLRNDKHYKYRNNHGLYTDAGLFTVALQLDRHPDAADWRKRAVERFVKNANATISSVDGVHLEHSPSYHMLITELLDKLVNELGIAREQLSPLLAKMTDAAAWFIMPDGTMPQLGDTNLGPAPKWAAEIQSKHTGFRAFADAGAAVYRDASSYFIAAAWYHSRSHKHADDGTFVWAEQGRRLIVDAGRYGYFYAEPGRIYAESSPAHNTLTVEPAFAWRSNKPYGSGVLGTASASGWHAVLITNPVVAKSGVAHRRVFAYRPGRALVVIDQVRAEPCPTSTRRFHFAPQLDLKDQTATGVRLADDTGSVWLENATATTSVRTLRGQKTPTVQGFTFPSDRKWVADTAVELDADTCNAPMVVGLFPAPDAPPAFSATTTTDDVRMTVGAERVHVRFADDALTLVVDERTP